MKANGLKISDMALGMNCTLMVIYIMGNMYEGKQKEKEHTFGVMEKPMKVNGFMGESMDIYVGQWRNGETSGYGVYTANSGQKYEGTWKHSCKHGKGTETFPNGDVYVGNYKGGYPQGQGKMMHKDGSIYEGNFDRGVKLGKGRWYKTVKKDDYIQKKKIKIDYVYIGDFQNNKKNGYGVFTWGQISTYEGQFSNDHRHGFGVCQWYDGSKYEGEWRQGVQYGKGKLTMKDGTVKQGIFQNNTLMHEIKSEEDTLKDSLQKSINRFLTLRSDFSIAKTLKRSALSSQRKKRREDKFNMSSNRDTILNIKSVQESDYKRMKSEQSSPQLKERFRKNRKSQSLLSNPDSSYRLN
ncbi:UNKNOWN [Stylonychia lemnae]|uniref:Morn repeat protein n=1 Tax=Stylonychia lemnae TaxID=5949 RepID=A0A077ZN81_STYLE|nr:UNKNOWN [Stylonychia lemnae]|eukprot:CDW71378.1 UNKNOWN [Stylonychia lemnae]